MTYSEELADRIREIVGFREGVTERKMFGGIAWMIHGNMAVGLTRDDGLMVRLPADEAELALKEDHVGPMDMSGRRMKAFVVVDSGGTAEDGDLAGWIDAGSDFAASMPPK